MKKINLILVMLVMMVFAGNALAAGFSIPIDIREPKRFNPTHYVSGGMTKEECDSALENSIGCNRAEFCVRIGPTRLEYELKERHRLMNLIQATASGDLVFVDMKARTYVQSAKTTVANFRNIRLKDGPKGENDIYKSSYGEARIYAYFIENSSDTPFALMKRADYMAERNYRNDKEAHKYVRGTEKETYRLVKTYWYRTIRQADKRIEHIQRLLFLCCSFNVHSHGGWPEMQNYKTTNDWTQQERMKMMSGKKETRNRVISDNKRLFKAATGKDYTKTTGSTSKKKKKKVVPPAPPGPTPATGGQVDLGRGGEMLFDTQFTENLNGNKTKKTSP